MVDQAQQLCTFTVDKYSFAVEVHKVQEVLRFQDMTPVPLAPREVRGLINLRGQIVTAIDLRRRLGLPDAPSPLTPMSVILRTDQGAVSLLVDGIGDVREAQDHLFEPPPATLRDLGRDLIRGVYKLPGELLILLDSDRAIASVVARAKTPPPPAPASSSAGSGSPAGHGVAGVASPGLKPDGGISR
jgi:purine-binding chemotaxis protein CheW